MHLGRGNEISLGIILAIAAIAIIGVLEFRPWMVSSLNRSVSERERLAELAREKARWPDFADGYATRERIGRASNTSVSPAVMKTLSGEHFKLSGKSDAPRWRQGFQRGFQDAVAATAQNR